MDLKSSNIDKIVIASTNKDKITQIINFGLFSECEMLSYPCAVEENGNSLQENALIKARHCFEKTGLPSLADDSGLFIQAIGGAPGIHCKRFAQKSNGYNNAAKILNDMLGKLEDRNAYFATAAAFVWDNIELTATGKTWGQFIYPGVPEESANNYRNFFIPKTENITCGQADLNDLRFCYHRFCAMRDLKTLISERFYKR
ncbi:MAG: non-canonical purine NTP pyrophosphatase [Holosporales bacterium]|jgi:XTP/dITP diphosphohydrolase|nr:non-canonical purine NTP pyrophosphatase [Holosporales bacterium]